MAPIFFWRETEEPHGFLCQWFSSPFQDENGITYLTAEHYMMYHKAQCYSSTKIAAEVLAAKNPRKTKSLGRKVDMTSDQGKRWEQEKYAVVEKGNLLKFRQHETLKTALLETGERELVEASSHDRIWGVGFPAQFAEENRHAWGMNMLGRALMSVRVQLKQEGQDSK